MQNVPKIVRERLKAATPVVNHPDADALTAFAEHSLLALERDVVLEHLARCGNCRDIVALALPATEPVQSDLSPSPSGWLTWPALRWGFVAAGIVAVASFGILQYQKSPRSTMMADKASTPRATTEAKNQLLATPAAPAPAENRDKIMASPAPAFADSVSATNLMAMQHVGPTGGSNADTKKTVIHAEAAGRAGGTASPGGTLGGQRSFGPRVMNQFQQQNVAQNQAPAPAPPAAFGKQQAGGTFPADASASAAAQTVEATGAAPLVAQSRNLDATLIQDQPAAQPPSSENYAYDKLSKAKLPVPPGQIGGYVIDPSGAAVSNARITVIPSKTGAATTAVTNSQGAWVIAGLPTGSYKAQAEAPGFTTTVVDLSYDANQPSMYSFTLGVGSVAESVEVSAQNGQVQTDGSGAEGAITDREVSQNGMNGRNLTQLITLSPGTGLLPLWAITSTGSLRRSVDQGKTWQDVDVNANSTSVTSASVEVAAQVSPAKAKDANEALKQQAAMHAIRAVAAAGADVWAGGSGSALYHSADAGNHWTRVVPASAGTVLTGDITSVEFPDPQHGKVSTSTAEVWLTSDSGQNWQKQ
jgi:hypothetical protein